MKYSEISHFSHPQHNLKFEYTEVPFKCDGCKEVGIGSRYKCAMCDFDLHMHCAIPSPTIYHPFYTKCSFKFHSRPPGDKSRYCNACERDVTGFVYHCNSCGYDLHPCCAKLPMVLDDGEVQLYLYRKVSAPCHKCGRKGRSWSYRSTCKKYNLHVACVKEMLVENWHELYFGRGKSRKLETRIPSLKNTLQTHHQQKSKGKVKKCCEMAGMAVQFVISAVLGDPTALIAGVIGSLMSAA
ncbi:ZZ domain-containing protein/C1_2 domain-containing protein [Cephalotus follicularis]|uniref:ZZ domain-containing protein/C1_2 domain-containing protein n=1 Tax=Cephalotus follicularis TaxID=3775 RepID=A0A1Q3CMP7_CEPFO|nr:ZZ domain-containing protein/C1_2 domain-containing protein [Cephalotus follicularis]